MAFDGAENMTGKSQPKKPPNYFCAECKERGHLKTLPAEDADAINKNGWGIVNARLVCKEHLNGLPCPGCKNKTAK